MFAWFQKPGNCPVADFLINFENQFLLKSCLHLSAAASGQTPGPSESLGAASLCARF